jgi:hypothetical protein
LPTASLTWRTSSIECRRGPRANVFVHVRPGSSACRRRRGTLSQRGRARSCRAAHAMTAQLPARRERLPPPALGQLSAFADLGEVHHIGVEAGGCARGRGRVVDRLSLLMPSDSALAIGLSSLHATTPRHSPKPIRAPARQWPRRITSSPVSRKRRGSPLGSVSGSVPRQVSSDQPRRGSLRGTRTVPLRDPPGRRLHPFELWRPSARRSSRRRAGCCGSASGGEAALAHRRASYTWVQVDAALRAVRSSLGTAAAVGRPPARGRPAPGRGERLGVTTQGLIEVAKLFGENGQAAGTPTSAVARRPVVEQAQAEGRPRPPRAGSAGRAGFRAPGRPPPELVVERAARAEARRRPAPPGSVWPCGARSGAAHHGDDARPWYPIGTHL